MAMVSDANDMTPETTVSGSVPSTLPIAFHGTSTAYFGIWLTNLVLTIATLGIWSAWAKVRRQRYFLGNTRLAGDGFDYLAHPVTILKGRLIAVAVLAAYVAIGYADQTAGDLLALAFIPLYPWVLNRSMRFNSRMTSWRNVRFDWSGEYKHACIAFLLWPVLAVLTMGILAPMAARYIRHFIANNTLFGTSKFYANTPITPYYGALGLAILAFVAATVPIMLISGGVAAGIATSSFPDEEMPPILLIPMIANTLGFALGLLVAGQVFAVMTRNILVRGLTLEGGHRFDSHLSAPGLVWIRLSNFVVSLATLGLMIPWAQIRAYRYQCGSLSVIPASDMTEFTDSDRMAGRATAGEFSDLQDLDISI